MSEPDAKLVAAELRSIDRDRWPRIFTIALCLPLLIWAINGGVVYLRFHRGLPFFAFYALFVAEVGLIAWCTGKYLRHPLLRWVVFVWCIVFVDVYFVLFRFTFYDEFNSVGYSFASAQLGLLIVWAVLGTANVGVRVFVALCGFVGVMTYVAGLTYGLVSRLPNWWRNDWDTILTWQAIATLLLCAALRWRGFRILSAADFVPSNPTGEDDEAKAEPVQFSIMHLLMWTSALAPIFALARLVDWSVMEFSYGLRMAQFAALAVLLSLTSLVAIWAGLGYGNWFLRTIVVLLFTISAGALVASASTRRWLERLDLDLYHTGNEAYVFWITWAVLAGFFYVAMLLVLRAEDRRLIRTPKVAGTLAVP